MRHLFVSREYPPAPYPPGGIGAYVINISRLLAERGEQVHVIGQRWSGAPLEREEFYGGNLVVHRIGADDLPRRSGTPERFIREREGLRKTTFPKQWFGWLAAYRIEDLVEEEGIDVIEAQEWEAPLYHFLLRRSLGLGPQRTPPCIVQMHSPTEWICRFNGPAALPREYPLMKRMETFCIRAADALLCPSHSFAQQAESHYALEPDSVKVIHLPKGPTAPIARDRNVWANGSICFVGRLEPRKGVIEWIEAAVQVAQDDSGVHFDFIGADLWGLQPALVRKAPRALRPRFRFHGSRSAAEIAGFLARAKAAVIPSRWENFPNVCIEAMASGLPVIATPFGGMAEMIEDGRTGWLTPDAGVAGMADGLADALRRCLAASPEERACMGGAACEAVTKICDNRRIVDEQIAFRASVRREGARRSLTAAAHAGSLGAHGLARASRFSGNAGVVVSARTCAEAEPVLASIAAQTCPAAVALVCRKPVSAEERARMERLTGSQVAMLVSARSERSDAWNAGYAAVRERIEAGFCLFLDSDDRLLPDCLARLSGAFEHRPEAGLISPWVGREHNPPLEAPLSPDLSLQLIRNEVGSASAFRVEAIGTPAPFRTLPTGYDLWQLSLAVLAKGWIGAAFPALLAERRGGPERIAWPEETALRAVRADVLRVAQGRISPMVLDLVNDHVLPSMAAAERTAARSEPAQIGVLMKSIVRRNISRTRRKLLRARRPPESL